jgi:hypothetical protein
MANSFRCIPPKIRYMGYFKLLEDDLEAHHIDQQFRNCFVTKGFALSLVDSHLE